MSWVGRPFPENVANEGELVLTPAGSGTGTGPLAVSAASQETGRHEEEAALLQRAKAGDAAAFAEIMARHERMVLMTALRILGRLDAAQDAAQEVFLRLHKYIGGFDEVRALAPWLYRVVVNACRDSQRRSRRAGLSLDALREDGRLDETADPLDLEAHTVLEQERRIVAKGLETLPDKERAALVLRDIEGLSTQEVAGILGSSETTVRSQISRGRLRLKAFVDRHLKSGTRQGRR